LSYPNTSGPCQLHNDVALVQLAFFPGTGHQLAMNSQVIPLPIPPGITGVTLYTQWFVINQDTLIHSVSESRRLVVQ